MLCHNPSNQKEAIVRNFTYNVRQYVVHRSIFMIGFYLGIEERGPAIIILNIGIGIAFFFQFKDVNKISCFRSKMKRRTSFVVSTITWRSMM